MAKEKIGFNDYQYGILMKRENAIKSYVEELKKISETVISLDKIDNYKAFLEEPADYLILKYWQENETFFPPNTLPELAITQNTNFNKDSVNSISSELKALIQSMGKHAPTINATDVIWNLNKENFNEYLDPKKKEHFQALKDFITASNKLREFDGSNMLHLVRYTPSLLMDGLGIKINKNNFIKR